MAVAFRSAATLTTTSGTSLAVAAPAGLADNDVMIAAVRVLSGAAITAPAGWTVIRALAQTTVYWKRASSESGTYTWSWTGNSQARATISAYTGVALTGSPVDAENGAEVTSAVNTITAPSCSPATSNAFLVFIALIRASGVDTTSTPPGGMTEDYDSGLRVSCAFSHEQLSASGATGSRVGTIDAAATSQNAGYLVALLTRTYTLTTSTGSFVLTGNAAGLLAGRKLSAQAGAFVLTGNAAALVAARRLPAQTGAFVLTGNSANFLLAHLMSVQAGAFVLTGNAAALNAARVLQAQAGAFVLTGNAVNLRIGHYLSAQTAAFSLTGNAVLFRAARKLVTAAGSFALTGNPVALLLSHRLSAQTGVFTYSGGDVAFSVLSNLVTALMRLFVRDGSAVLDNYPSAWAAFDRLRFIGPPKGLLADSYAFTLAPNEQVAPLFCRALYLDAAIFLCTKDEDYEQAAKLRDEHADVVRSLMGQVRAQKSTLARRFPEAKSIG